MPIESSMFGVWDVMGKNEHLLYRGDTFELANSVSKVVQVEEFVAHTASLHVLVESMHYARKNVAVFLPLQGTKYALIQVKH